MTLPAEVAKELAAFPPALRALVDAELAAGNAIVEVGHSHPAPPVGAYVRLARRVTTRPRASGDGLAFYERNSSIYSGEFTDATRFFFVLEPPNPPPPEPDMDAIRKAHEPRPDPIVQVAMRPTGVRPVNVPGAEGSETWLETATGCHHALHFRDARPPHLVQAGLERELEVLFTGGLSNGVLEWQARGDVVGAPYDFALRFVAALPHENCYLLTTDASWVGRSATDHEYYRKTSASWIRMWTRDLRPAAPPGPHEGSPERYRELAEGALHAEAHLDTVAAIQAEIIRGLKAGGRYATSHKEGGTNITWRLDHFARADYGDYPDLQQFRDEAEFLEMLRRFSHFTVTRHAPREPLSELDTWKLILRQMRDA